MLTKFRASHMRCALGYRHNDITVLIIGKPNKDDNFIMTVPRKASRIKGSEYFFEPGSFFWGTDLWV